MNVANKLTMLRIILVPVFMGIMYMPDGKGAFWGAVIFALASITDFLDGYLARKYNMITNFGKFMDPLADKILVAAAMISMVEFDMIPAWMVVIIIAREFAISIIRAIAASSGKVIAASNWGKAKTVSQIAAILMVLLNIPFGMIVMYIAVGLTLYSGYDYIALNKEIITME